MTKLEVRTDRFSNDIVAAQRTIVGDGVRVETPTATIQPKTLRQSEDVDPTVCGVQEVYRRFGDDDLTAVTRGTDSQFIDDLDSQAQNIDGMLTAAFLKYNETGEISQSDAALLVDILATVSDIITVPLMPKTARLVGTGEAETPLRDTSYQAYRNSVERILSKAADRAPEMTVMGALPMVGWSYIENLLSIYDQYDVQIYCLNFDRTRITAGTQVSMMRPLQRHITRMGIEDDVLLYGMNMVPANNDDALGLRPADDFNGLGVGLDIIGGVHEGVRMPPKEIEAMKDGESEETFKLFDRIQLGYRNISVGQIASSIPDDIAPGSEFIQQRVVAGSSQTRRRLEKVVNAQQMAHAADEVRQALSNDRAAEELAGRVGVTEATIDAFRQVRTGFDNGQNQSSLEDF